MNCLTSSAGVRDEIRSTMSMKTKMTYLLVLLLLLSAWIMPVQAESASTSGFDAEALDAYINGQMSKHGIKGISVAVTSETEIVYLKGYGTAGNSRALTP